MVTSADAPIHWQEKAVRVSYVSILHCYPEIDIRKDVHTG